MRNGSLLMLAAAAVLTACSSTKPPIPDETRRTPANDRRELAALQCTTDLVSTKGSLNEALRLAERSSAMASELQVENARLHGAVQLARMSANSAPPSQIFVVFYRTNVTAFDIAEPDAARLINAIRTAAHIEVRGRTDGEFESPAESRIARLRAEQAQLWLIRAGVEPSRVVATWQPIGDHLGPNNNAEGRALNRRVEIEVYAVRPMRGIPELSASAANTISR